MSEDELKTLEEMERKATPGDWLADESIGDGIYVMHGRELKIVIESVWALPADIAFAAAARNALPKLLATIRQQAETLAKLPRTADGVPIVPGMKVYAFDAEKSDLLYDWIVPDSEYIDLIETVDGKYEGHGEPPDLLYSTEAAALAATKGPDAET